MIATVCICMQIQLNQFTAAAIGLLQLITTNCSMKISNATLKTPTITTHTKMNILSIIINQTKVWRHRKKIVKEKHILKKKNNNYDHNHQFLKWIASRPHSFDIAISRLAVYLEWIGMAKTKFKKNSLN